MPNARARPKSANFSSPVLLINRFCGLRSRWRMFLLWQYDKPRNNWNRNDLTTSGSMSPLRESKYFLRSWSQCSNTNVNFRSECRTSCSLTILRCLSSFSRHISRKADDGTPYKLWLEVIHFNMNRFIYTEISVTINELFLTHLYLIIVVQPYSFQSDNLLSFLVFSLKNCAISTCNERQLKVYLGLPLKQYYSPPPSLSRMIHYSTTS